MSFASIMGLIVTAILAENYIFSKFLGCCPFLGLSENPSNALGMGCAVTFVMTLSSLITSLINKFILVAFDLEYLQTIVCILVIAALVQLVEIILKKFMPPLYNALGIYLPLITTNCAVLGVVLLNFTEGYTFLESIVNSIGAGLGFMLAMVIFSGVRSRLESCDVPKFLQGLPIVLIAASIVSLSFMGFTGLVEGILG